MTATVALSAQPKQVSITPALEDVFGGKIARLLSYLESDEKVDC